MKKKWIAFVLAAAMTLVLAACGKEEGGTDAASGSEGTVSESSGEEGEAGGDAVAGKHHVEITVKDYGKITARSRWNWMRMRLPSQWRIS